MRSSLLAIVVTVLLAVPALADAAEPTGRVMLRFDAEPAPALLQRLVERTGIATFERRAGGWPVFTATLDGGADPAALSTRLAERPEVLWAEPELRLDIVLHGAPDDPYFDDAWHLLNVGQLDGGLPGADTNVLAAWEISTGEGVQIAVLDTGVDTTHPDLNVVHGVDVIDDDLDPYPDTSDGGNGHGTMVAGVAAAIGDNGIGVVGVAPSAGIIAMRSLGGGDVGDIYDAFVLSTDAGADVLNNSWGYGDSECSPVPTINAIATAVDYARIEGRDGLGAVVVFSSGNQGCEQLEYPVLAQAGVIAVGSLTDQDRKYGYSAWGPHMDLMAPSGGLGGGGRPGLMATDVVGDFGWGNLGENNEYTASMGGTSGAAPVVSGVVALMFGANPRLTWQDVEELLCLTAVRVQPESAAYDATGWSNTHGCGRVDAAAAVAAVADEGPPGAAPWRLADGAAVPVDAVVLAWDPADEPDGDLVTYDLVVAPSGGGEAIVLEELAETRVDLTGQVGLGRWELRLTGWDEWGAGETSEIEVVVVEPPALPEPDEGEGCSASVAASKGAGGGVTLALLAALLVLGRRHDAW